MSDWAHVGDGLGSFIEQQTTACLTVYRQDQRRIEEDAAIELTAAEGGYGRKQLFELIQNAADALHGSPGDIHVVLTEKALYVANSGNPFDEKGAESVLASHLSRKSKDEIGQFGLGFKSVTAISDQVTILSQSGSFVFDRTWAAEQIRQAGLKSPSFPMLRLARSIDPHQVASQDRVVKRLFEWSSTVIRVSLKSGRADLANDIESFPATFLLFSPNTREVRLEDDRADSLRVLRRTHEDTQIVLSDNGQESRWVVSSLLHHPSKDATQDAGKLTRRPTVEVSWAAPLSGAHGLGEFWAYFPTGIQTTLSGIVNAPWKLSADRLSMIPGAYNHELLTVVLPKLVALGLPKLVNEEDPGSVLDALPARGREGRSWADEELNVPVFEVVAQQPCLPNLDGILRPSSSLRLHPSGLPQAWKDEWNSPTRSAWVHHSVDRTPERRLKAERLAGRAKDSTVSLPMWLEAMCSDHQPQTSARAIKLAATIANLDRAHLQAVCEARIVLLEDGRMTRPHRGRVFLRSEHDSADHDFIHPELAENEGVGEALSDLGIEILNPAGELRSALQQRPVGPAWRDVWPLIDAVDTDTALYILQEELGPSLTASVFAQTTSGKWKALTDCYMAGEVIPRDSGRDTDYLISPTYHARHETVLERCGAVASPRLIGGVSDEPWLATYKTKQAELYRDSMDRPKPHLSKIAVTGPPPPWPLEPLPALSLQARATITQRVLDQGSAQPWRVFHTTSNYPTVSVRNPVVDLIIRYGALPTTIGPADPLVCLHPESALPDCFPRAQVSNEWASALRLPLDCSAWAPARWLGFLRDSVTHRPESIATVYAVAAAAGATPPEKLLVSRGLASIEVPRSEVAVTDDSSIHASLIAAGIPSLLTPTADDRDALIGIWGLADGKGILKEETVAHPDSNPTPLLDLFPPLRLYDRDIPDLDLLEVQICSSIDVLVSTPRGQESRSVASHRDGERLYLINGSPPDLLDHLGQCLRVSLNTRTILEQMEKQASSALRLSIAEADELADKLVIAVGADSLRARLPRTALEDLQKARRATLTPHELGELALSVHGYLVLNELRRELAEAGLEPPMAWAGSREARKFVEALGFPPEYAGFPGANLSPTLYVEGRVSLSPLHDYQERVIERIRDILSVQRKDRRGMVTLPTGAGKTRVAVQAVVELASSGSMAGPVVWIGQSEELCEQAVQAWAYVWRAIGAGPLMLSRFWHGNEISEAGLGSFQVVVATIDKLAAAINKPEYDWLKNPDLIIVDEAHTSIAPSYTNVFRWLGGETVTSRMSTPLLGLTATAYRGHNETETERLVKRYGSNKLDEGIFEREEPYSHLQRIGVLAQVHQQVLTGMQIPWSQGLEQSISTWGVLSKDAENTVGQDFRRNQVILESIMSQPRDWPILMFASSVDHARAMAAELSYYGVLARPISGATDTALRRRYVEEFRAGEIQVLTNYNVLTQGFDAPMVRAVYVTRPTFSPNLYQQMIGRGLRGPRNGGSEDVLIVNIADNLEQYGGQLAFHHFDHLWEQQA